MPTLVSQALELDAFVHPPFPVRRWSVAEYLQLTESGFLTADDKVELLAGWIVPRMTHNAPHDSAIQRLVRRLFQSLLDDWDVRVQSAITTGDSVPEPDVAVVPGPEGRFDQQRPTVGEVELVVEVSDTTLRQDRMKREIYAAAEIPTYWIVNLQGRTIEVSSQPDREAGGYSVERTYGEQESVPVVIGGNVICEIPVIRILPSRSS